MLNIEAFCARDDATAWYRVKWPLQAMAEKGMCKFRIHYELDWHSISDLPGVVIFQRTVTQEHLNLMKSFREQGVKVVYDMDDDLPNIDPTNIANLVLGHDRTVIAKHYQALVNPNNPFIKTVFKDYEPLSKMTQAQVIEMAQGNFNRAIQFAKECDLMTVSTPSLAKTYRGWGVKNIAVLPNQEKAGEWRGIVKAPLLGRTVIGWAGGLSHYFTDLKPIKNAVAMVMHKHPEVNLHIIGLAEAKAVFDNSPQDRIFTEPYASWEKYKELVSEFDVTLAPSFGNKKFARGKSNIRCLQSWMNGIPVVASELTYGDSVRESQGGYICKTSAEWENALQRICSGGDLRRSLGRNGRAYAELNTYEQNCGAWLEAYQEILK